MKHDLLDLIDYLERQARLTKNWSTANDGEVTKDKHFFHTRSVILLSDILKSYEESINEA